MWSLLIVIVSVTTTEVYGESCARGLPRDAKFNQVTSGTVFDFGQLEIDPRTSCTREFSLAERGGMIALSTGSFGQRTQFQDLVREVYWKQSCQVCGDFKNLKPRFVGQQKVESMSSDLKAPFASEIDFEVLSWRESGAFKQSLFFVTFEPTAEGQSQMRLDCFAEEGKRLGELPVNSVLAKFADLKISCAPPTPSAE